ELEQMEADLPRYADIGMEDEQGRALRGLVR
ncbi:hypothetical protein XPU_0712, partial [Xanthomonas arboricola pv. pruni str. MAFF 311562]